MSANTVSSYCNSGNGDGDGGGRKDRRKKTDKKSALNPAASSASSHGEKASGMLPRLTVLKRNLLLLLPLHFQ